MPPFGSERLEQRPQSFSSLADTTGKDLLIPAKSIPTPHSQTSSMFSVIPIGNQSLDRQAFGQARRYLHHKCPQKAQCPSSPRLPDVVGASPIGDLDQIPMDVTEEPSILDDVMEMRITSPNLEEFSGLMIPIPDPSSKQTRNMASMTVANNEVLSGRTLSLPTKRISELSTISEHGAYHRWWHGARSQIDSSTFQRCFIDFFNKASLHTKYTQCSLCFDHITGSHLVSSGAARFVRLIARFLHHLNWAHRATIFQLTSIMLAWSSDSPCSPWRFGLFKGRCWSCFDWVPIGIMFSDHFTACVLHRLDHYSNEVSPQNDTHITSWHWLRLLECCARENVSRSEYELRLNAAAKYYVDTSTLRFVDILRTWIRTEWPE